MKLCKENGHFKSALARKISKRKGLAEILGDMLPTNPVSRTYYIARQYSILKILGDMLHTNQVKWHTLYCDSTLEILGDIQPNNLYQIVPVI